MIHRFVDLLDEVVPPIVYMLEETDSGAVTYAIWGVPATGGTPYRFTSTSVSNAAGDLLADPMLSPDGTEVVYCQVDTAGPDGLYVTAADGAGGITQIASDSSLPDVSMQPHWKPDSTQIVWRDLSTTDRFIKRVDRDGSNLTTLYTEAGNNLLFPRYSYDGTKIMFVKDKATDELWVMNADGSSPASIKTGLFSDAAEPSWANTSNTIAYWTTGGQWRKINADGTGDTLLATDPNPFWGLTRFAWAPDDSALLVFYRDPAASPPRGTLTSISTTGGGATTISPARTSYVLTEKHLPFVFANGRVYWARIDSGGASPTIAELVSCAVDGSDYRQEQDFLAPPSPWDTLRWRGFAGRSV